VAQPVSRVSRATLALQLEDALRTDILSGDLRPGERLRAADLAPRYGVSATPLREALQRLAVEGLVVLDARVGVTVSKISTGDLRDVYETRSVLESEALRRAIECGDAAWVERLGKAFEGLRKVTPRKVLARQRGQDAARAWSLAHRQFDVELYSACPSPWLLRFIEMLSMRCERYRRAAGQLANAYATWLLEHEEIYRAVEQRDAKRAVAVLQRHLRGTQQMLEHDLADTLAPLEGSEGG
jgi:GntR family transcriptional regulator, carbon starvation induced regulator